MIEWTPKLSTGVPVLDGHHQELFRRIAAIQEAMVEQRTLFGVYALTRLKHFVREHFAAEEALMKAAGYPRFKEHVAEHEAFRDRLSQVLLRSIGQDMQAETLSFLEDWLTHHIAKVDMDYVPWVEKLEKTEKA